MRSQALAALPLLMTATLLTVPASAHDTRAEPDSSVQMKEMANRFADPAMQDDVSNVVEAMTDVMLNLPVGQFAEVVERTRPGTVDEHIDRNTRLGDLVGPDADHMAARAGDGTRASMAAMGSFMRAFADILPEFQKLGREIEASAEDARQRR